MAADHRSDFAFDPGVIYLNCAYHGPMPRVALAAVEGALALKRSPDRLAEEYHFTFPNAYRQAVAKLLGVAPELVAVTDSATQGLMLLVGGLDWRPGDEVLLPEHTFPANLFPWLSLERRGVVVRRVNEGLGDGVRSFAEGISANTRVVSVDWVSYSTGRRRDLAALGELCRERGVLLAVDATQGIGGLAFDLAATPVDLLACAGYKWLLGPYGVGFAVLAPALVEQLAPINISWQAVVGAEDFNRLADCELELVAEARRFDRNEAASFFNLAGATASLRYLSEVGPAAVEEHVGRLQDRLLMRLPPDYSVVSSLAPGERSNILSIAAGDPAATAAAHRRLAAAGVRLSLRQDALRIAPHLYNSEEEIDAVVELLGAG
jgi:selenocysteine lyase/cysteine desulfurase